jgi:outer membrane lipoprotein-sorting protein
MRNVQLSRRSRWVVPAGALAVTGALIAGVPALMSSAAAAPALPAKTPAQLLAQLAGEHQAPPPLTGTITETVSLGLPKLPDTGNPNSVTSLLTGSHTVNIWYAGPKSFRLSLPQSESETDIYRDGTTAYLWQSTSDSVTKFILPNKPDATAPSTVTTLTPQQAADEALAMLGKSTSVTVASNETVAGQAAYTLVLSPRESGSLIGQVSIAIDAKNNVPLQVQLYARGASTPAISVGFTKVSFTRPSAADLSFTPSATQKVTTVNSKPGANAGGVPAGATAGSGWLTVAELPSSVLSEAAGANTGNGTGVQGASAAEASAGLNALVNDATPVSGSWGSGSIIKTSLLTILITGNKVYLGAVDPSVLYAAAK